MSTRHQRQKCRQHTVRARSVSKSHYEICFWKSNNNNDDNDKIDNEIEKKTCSNRLESLQNLVSSSLCAASRILRGIFPLLHSVQYRKQQNAIRIEQENALRCLTALMHSPFFVLSREMRESELKGAIC